MTQSTLSWDISPSYAPEDFVPASSNEAARLFIDSWPRWPSFAAVLTGPEGSGKTHLAHAIHLRAPQGPWIERAALSGLDIAALSIEPGSLAVIDSLGAGAFSAEEEAQLLHLYNVIQQTKAYVLLCSEPPPARWDLALPDLASRLRSLPVAALQAPDDAMIALVLRKLFADRQIHVDDPVVDYMTRRIERSLRAAYRWVARIDHASLASQRPITVPLVRDLLHQETGA